MLGVFLQGAMQGTIPYLGTFLTDLTMMDTALPDFVEVRWLLNGQSVRGSFNPDHFPGCFIHRLFI